MEWLAGLREWWRRLLDQSRDADPAVRPPAKHSETITTPPTPKEPSDLRKPKSKLPR